MKIIAYILLLFSAQLSAQDFFPVEKGRSWEYETYTRDGRINFSMQVEMLKPQKRGGQTYQVMQQKDSRGIMYSYITKDSIGVYVHRTGLRKTLLGASTPEVEASHDPPIPLFIYPDDDTKSFEWEGRIRIAFVNKPVKMRGEMLGFENITVPAGEFECFKIRFTQTRGDEETVEYAWYAQGVGQVKYEGDKYIKELKKYSR